MTYHFKTNIKLHCSWPYSDRLISSFKDYNIGNKAIQSHIDLDQNCFEKLRTKNSLKKTVFLRTK